MTRHQHIVYINTKRRIRREAGDPLTAIGGGLVIMGLLVLGGTSPLAGFIFGGLIMAGGLAWGLNIECWARDAASQARGGRG